MIPSRECSTARFPGAAVAGKFRALGKYAAGFAAVATALLAGATAHAQVGAAGKVEITKIAPAFVATPEYEFQGEKKRTPGRVGKWLEVEVEFSSEAEFTEELSFNYYILFNGKLLVGEVTHVSIPKGKGLYSVVYVSPRSIERVMANKPLNANAVENVGVEIRRAGALVTSQSFNSKTKPNWWQTLEQVPGMVVNKNETPFAPLYWDRYEAIRSTR
jgi:hypothetical protein